MALRAFRLEILADALLYSALSFTDAKVRMRALCSATSSILSNCVNPQQQAITQGKSSVQKALEAATSRAGLPTSVVEVNEDTNEAILLSCHGAASNACSCI